MDWLDSHISIETLLWLFPITFLIHDFEEIIFVEAWFKKNYGRVLPLIPKKLKGTFQEMSRTTSARFSIPVFLQFIVYVIASFIAVEQQYYGVLIGVNVILLLHVFMHIGQSLFIKTYALGVGTAVLVTLPYTVYLFYRLIFEGLIRPIELLIYTPFGILTIVVLLLGHKISRKILSD